MTDIISAVELECKQIFDDRAYELELERKQLRRLRRLGLNVQKRESGQAGRRNRAQPASRLPRKGMPYVQKLATAIKRLFEDFDMWASHAQNEKRTFEWEWGTTNIELERALLHLLFARGEYDKVLEGVKSVRLDLFPRSTFGEIQDLWDHSNYQTADIPRPVSEFTPVITFRIRQKNPCPTWALTGRSKYNIPEKAKRVLDEHCKITAKPSKDDKEQLMIETGLNYQTISNWFKNRRQRRLIKKIRPTPPAERESFPSISTNQQLKLEETTSLDQSVESNTSGYSSSSFASSCLSNTVKTEEYDTPDGQYLIPDPNVRLYTVPVYSNQYSDLQSVNIQCTETTASTIYLEMQGQHQPLNTYCCSSNCCCDYCLSDYHVCFEENWPEPISF